MTSPMDWTTDFSSQGDLACEERRIRDLAKYSILDTNPEPEFDKIVELVSHIFKHSMAAISFIDRSRLWFKAKIGINELEISRLENVCNYTIKSDDVLVVPDLSVDARFSSLKLIAGEPYIRFYAGAPIITPEGSRIGTLHILSPTPHERLTPEEEATLREFSSLIMSIIERRVMYKSYERIQSYKNDTDDILSIIASGEYNSDVLSTLLARVCKFHQASIGRIWRYENGAITPIADFAGRPGLDEYFARSKNMRLTPANSGVAAAIISGKPHYRFVAASESTSHPLRVEMQKLGMRCQILHPVEFLGERLALIMSFDRVRDDLPEVASDIAGRVNLIKAAILKKQSDDALLLLREALNSTPDAALITNAEDIEGSGPYIIFANNAFLNMTGYDRNEIIGLSPRVLQGPNTNKNETAKIKRAIITKKPIFSHIQNYTKNGIPYWIDLMIAPVIGKSGQVRNYISIQRDVTERRQEFLEQQYDTALRTIGEIASSVAHDFSNFLTSINMNAAIIKRSNPNPISINVNVEEIERASASAASVIKGLLRYAKGHAPDDNYISIKDVIIELSTIMTRVLGDHIKFSFSSEEISQKCLLDRGQLESAIMNLVLNARDAMPTGGHIDISVFIENMYESEVEAFQNILSGAYVCVAIKDTGVGISEIDLKRITDPFYSTKGSMGTGLGLTQVRRFVNSINGDLRIKSAEGEGTEAKIYLPLDN